MQTYLEIAALAAAVLALLPAALLTWGLAGADGDVRDQVSPLLGFVLFAAAVAGVAVAARPGAGSDAVHLAVLAAPAALLLLAAPFATTRRRGRMPVVGIVGGLVVLSLAPALALAAVVTA